MYLSLCKCFVAHYGYKHNAKCVVLFPTFSGQCVVEVERRQSSTELPDAWHNAFHTALGTQVVVSCIRAVVSLNLNLPTSFTLASFTDVFLCLFQLVCTALFRPPEKEDEYVPHDQGPCDPRLYGILIDDDRLRRRAAVLHKTLRGEDPATTLPEAARSAIDAIYPTALFSIAPTSTRGFPVFHATVATSSS